MSENNNDPNPNPIVIDRGPDIQKSLKSIRNYLVIAALCWGVSLFFAGIILSAAGAVCSIVALRKILNLEKREPHVRQAIKILKVISIICLCACVLAFALTVFYIVEMLPTIIEAAETGDYSKLGLDPSTGGKSDSFTW